MPFAVYQPVVKVPKPPTLFTLRAEEDGAAIALMALAPGQNKDTDGWWYVGVIDARGFHPCGSCSAALGFAVDSQERIVCTPG